MILDTIVESKRREVARLRAQGIAEPASEPAPPRGFARALRGDHLAIIAEAKKASPSKGVIAVDFDPVAIARDYEAGGASCISVLTDEEFFQGHLDYLHAVRAAVGLPVLRKDFIIDEIQVRQAACYGADAILLIAAILDGAQMRDLAAQAADSGMDVLVEVHDEGEAEVALAAGATLIGINNRNLKDFSVDIETTFRVMAGIPASVPVVSESGLRGREDIVRLAAHGVNAALIGESLMRAGDRIAGLRSLGGIEITPRQ